MGRSLVVTPSVQSSPLHHTFVVGGLSIFQHCTSGSCAVYSVPYASNKAANESTFMRPGRSCQITVPLDLLHAKCSIFSICIYIFTAIMPCCPTHLLLSFMHYEPSASFHPLLRLLSSATDRIPIEVIFVSYPLCILRDLVQILLRSSVHLPACLAR